MNIVEHVSLLHAGNPQGIRQVVVAFTRNDAGSTGTQQAEEFKSINSYHLLLSSSPSGSRTST